MELNINSPKYYKIRYMEKAEIINERYPHVVRILRKGVGEGIEDDPFAEE